MSNHIKVRLLDGVWTVRAGGAVLGESDSALELTEGEYPPVVYFPRADIGLAFLEKTDKSTHCPWKGDASYYSIVTKSKVIENAAWSYESPKEEMARIADHLAFYASDDVTIEEI